MRSAVVCSGLIAVSILMDDIRFVKLRVNSERCGNSPSDGFLTSLVPEQETHSTDGASRFGPLHRKASGCQILSISPVHIPQAQVPTLIALNIIQTSCRQVSLGVIQSRRLAIHSLTVKRRSIAHSPTIAPCPDDTSHRAKPTAKRIHTWIL